MNIETFRNYCLGLPGVTEKMPFEKFAKGRLAILVFYVSGHMFCYFDINNFSSITVKCQPQRMAALKEHYDAVGAPYNGNPRYWMSITMGADMTDSQVMELVRNSYELVKQRKR